MRRMLTTCPSCGGDLYISELTCTSCDTVIRGRYTGCSFCELSDENLRFLELFVVCRGNVKEMERETGLGYWTIRNHLDDAVQALEHALERHAPRGGDASPDAGNPGSADAQRRAILEAVERGELSIVEAEQQLAHLTRRKNT